MLNFSYFFQHPHRNRFLLFSILFLAIVLRLLYIQNVTADEVMYTTEAMNMLHDAYDIHEIHHGPALRYVFVGIVAFFVVLFGPSHLGVILLPVLFSLGSIVLTYLVIKFLYGEKHAFLAAFLLAIFPLNLKYSTVLEADVLISFLMLVCFSIYLFYKSDWKFFLIGIILGIGLFIKLFIILFLFLLCVELIKTRNMRLFSLLFMGILIGSGPFILFQYIETGDLLYHITKDTALALEYYQAHSEETVTFFTYLFNPFSQYPEPTLLNIYVFLAFLLFCTEMWQKSTSFPFFWLWLFSGYALVEIPTLIPAIQRYLILLEVPLVVLAAAQLKKIKNLFCLFLVLCLLLSFTFWQLEAVAPYFTEPATSYQEQIAEFLKTLPQKDVYIMHNIEVPYLTHYLGYTYNYSGLFGYRGPANYTFYDLHFVSSLHDIKNDTYLILRHDLFVDETDFGDYYKSRNLTLDVIKEAEEEMPLRWHLLYKIYPLSDPSITYYSVWYVVDQKDFVDDNTLLLQLRSGG